LVVLPQDANPASRPGARNLQCPYYVFCLDIAAANLWADFTCEFCFYRKCKQATNIEELDLCAPGWEDIWGGSG
jgi:hypothetical protein